MKTYKLNGMDIYIVNVFSKKEAVAIALINKIGLTEENLTAIDYEVDRDFGMGILCRSYEELKNFIL